MQKCLSNKQHDTGMCTKKSQHTIQPEELFLSFLLGENFDSFNIQQLSHKRLLSSSCSKNVYVVSFKLEQRFPTEDHLMIHRHKHEMTLKFPSIKNDNMLSGELCLHQYRPIQCWSGAGLFADVCQGDSSADTLVCHQKPLWHVLYKL